MDFGIPFGAFFHRRRGYQDRGGSGNLRWAAGVQYGPCYHLACDTLENVSLDALDQMSNAAAHAVLTLADTT